MKLEKLSVKKFLQFIVCATLVTIFITLLGLLLIMKDLLIILYRGLLTAILLIWGGIFLPYFQI